MSDPGFREIHLTTKQVVFLFMAGLVALVGVFLLGVRAGRGVTTDRQSETAQNTDPAADVKAGGVMPPATSPKPDELKYHDDLQGRAGRATAPPIPPDAPPDPTPSPTAAAAAKPSPTPASKSAPATTASKPPPSNASGLYVQVDSFGSKANADRQLAQLKKLGLAAFIYEAPGPGAKYKVRVGPFPDARAAEAVRDRLRKEGFRPSITR